MMRKSSVGSSKIRYQLLLFQRLHELRGLRRPCHPQAVQVPTGELEYLLVCLAEQELWKVTALAERKRERVMQKRTECLHRGRPLCLT
jgi:hypothetical protein